MSTDAASQERPITTLRGTRDWLPGEFAQLAALETLLLDRFARAGYEPLRTPILEPTELHERKSGAGIVSKLYELAGPLAEPACLRPELTAGIVRAFAESPEAPPLPWRVSHAGAVFRLEADPQPGHYREFRQVGVELLGAAGPAFDGEVLWLAAWALAEAGVPDATIRIGHVGLLLEALGRSGLPKPAQVALIERLSEAAARGETLHALEAGLEAFAAWIEAAEAVEGPIPDGDGEGESDRLFRTLVPVVNGRRSGREILGRLRRKWELGHRLHGVLEGVRRRVRELADLRGPAAEVLDRLDRDYRSLAPDSIDAVRGLVATLEAYGIHSDRVELDLGFGRGIGFYSQMIFELLVPTPSGPVEVCGGGRYDGLARVLGSDRDARGVGFAFGLERLRHALDVRGEGVGAPSVPDGFLILAGSPDAVEPAVRLSAYLRSKGGRAVLETGRTLAEGMEHARTLGLARVVEVRPSEEDMGELILHDLATGRSGAAEAYGLRQLLRGGKGECR